MTSEPEAGTDHRGGGRRRKLLLPAAVAVLLVAAALSLSLRGPAERETAAPEEPEVDDAPADPPPEKEEPTPDEPSDAPSPDPLRELVDTVADQVASIRGLPAEEPIEAEVQDSEELVDTVAELAARDRDPEELEIRRRVLVALRLLPDDLDLEATLEELLGEQVAGLYSPEEGTLYVRADDAEDLSPGEEVTLAHEVLHALQDQSFGLRRFLELPDHDPDAGLAAQALIEGDAVLTQELWSLQNQSEEERAARLDDLADVDTERLEQAPRYVRESLMFPYQEGLAFVRALHEDGGFEAVDAALEDPPTASVEIIEPQRYLDGEGLADVSVPGTPNTDWTPVGDYTYGAFDLRSLLGELDRAAAADLAAGWAGGRVEVWERDDDLAVGMALAFRSDELASQACGVLGRWYSAVADGTEVEDPGVYEGDRDWAAVRCIDEEVSLGIAPDDGTARSLAGD